MSLPEFSYLTSRMLMGGQIDSVEKMRGLLGIGVTHIVSTLCENEQNQDDLWLNALYGMEGVLHRPAYVHAPIADDHEGKAVEWFGEVVPFVLKALVVPGAMVYGHCAAGRSRSGLLWYAVLRALGFGGDEAELFILAKRSEATFWPEYRASAESALVALGYV